MKLEPLSETCHTGLPASAWPLALGKTKLLHGKAILGCMVVVGASLLVKWGASERTADFGPDVLARDFVRIESTNFVWRASGPERALHYVRHWGQRYTLTFKPVGTTELTNVLSAYSQWAARPVYVQRKIATMGIGAISVSARTHGGVVNALEEVLQTNGITCALSRDGSATIVRSTRLDD